MSIFSQAVYSFRDLICLVSGIPITGFSEGDDCIIIKRRTDVVTLTVGADGFGTLAKSADRSYEITLKLMDTSPANGILQDILTTSDYIGTVIFPLQIQNLSGLDRCSSSAAVISKQPDLQAGAGTNTREWVILTNSADVYVGGNLV